MAAWPVSVSSAIRASSVMVVRLGGKVSFQHRARYRKRNPAVEKSAVFCSGRRPRRRASRQEQAPRDSPGRAYLNRGWQARRRIAEGRQPSRRISLPTRRWKNSSIIGLWPTIIAEVSCRSAKASSIIGLWPMIELVDIVDGSSSLTDVGGSQLGVWRQRMAVEAMMRSGLVALAATPSSDTRRSAKLVVTEVRSKSDWPGWRPGGTGVATR